MLKRLHRRPGIMLKRLHRRLGPAGIVVSVLALVIALAGVAVAAGGLNPQQKKEVKKIAQKYAGKEGKQGPPGPQGPQGNPGANGKEGVPGPKGSTGVTGATGPTGLQGLQGIKGATGPTGPTGVTGPEGICGTSNCTLPSGATETGTWGITPLAKASGFFGLHIPISFPIPLAASIEDAPECGEAGHPACVIHIFEGETIPSGCTGTKDEVGNVIGLGAEPGNFCVDLFNHANLVAAQLHPLNPEVGGFSVSPRGANLSATAEEGAFALGTWAVTAP